MKGIIPTGGRGTRMQPITFSTNKHFIPVGNKPLIFYPIEALADAGIKEIALTYNPGWLDYVKSQLGNGRKWGVKFTYVLQEKPIGLTNIFQVCEEFLDGESFVLHLGDNIFVNGVKKQVRYFNKHKPNALVTKVKVKHGENKRMGVPYLTKGGKLKKYIEKPTNPPNDFGIPGLYFFDRNVFKCFKGKGKIKPSARGELEIGSPYNWLIKHGFDVEVQEYTGKWLDPGKFGDWIESNQYLLDETAESLVESRLSKSVKIEGRVKIGKRCKIKNSKLRGPIAIGDSVTIIDSYIGPFSSISDDCEIDKSHIENSVLMRGVKIKKVKRPIQESLIGAEAQVVTDNGPSASLNLFIGEKSKIIL